MYVSVDHEKLVFLHKHPDFRVVANLDFIANRSHHTSSFPLECQRPLNHFSQDDLVKLFRNTTDGKDPPTGDKETLEEVIRQLAMFLPDTACDPAEVERQAAWFEDKFPNGMAGFGYMRGANTPKECTELAKLATPRDPVELVQGARQTVARNQLARQAHYNRVGAQPVPALPPSARTGGNARNAGQPAPRPGSGVCKAIWEALDLDLQMTGQIPPRQRVKDLALKNGWNLSTAGVQYGAWLKDKQK